MSNYPSGYNAPESLDDYLSRLEEWQPCFHAGCLNHVTHPCEVCGRITGKTPVKTPITEGELDER